MSFIITLHVQEGIVMASDSRITFSSVRKENGQTIVDNAISLSDTSYKTFKAGDSIGISMFGAANIKGVPMSGFVESFINEKIIEAKTDIDDVPRMLVEYFKTMSEVPDTGFHVAGYKVINNTRVKKVWRVYILQEKIIEIVPEQQLRGAIWDGEQDVLIRLFNSNLHIKNEKSNYVPLDSHRIPFESFTLQDAIDFAIYAVRTTADTMRFQMRPNTVGGPINVLIIKQSESFWLQRKPLVS